MGKDPDNAERRRIKERLKEYRKAAGLKQPEAAILSGVKLGTLQNWESGKSRADPEQLRPLAETYGCDPEDFLSDAKPVVRHEKMRRTVAVFAHPLASFTEREISPLRTKAKEASDSHWRRQQRAARSDGDGSPGPTETQSQATRR